MLFVIMTVFIIIIKFFLFSFFWSIVIFELAPLLVSFNFGATTFQLFHPFCIAFIIRHTWFAVYEPCCSLEVLSNASLFHSLSLSLSLTFPHYTIWVLYILSRYLTTCWDMSIIQFTPTRLLMLLQQFLFYWELYCTF